MMHDDMARWEVQDFICNKIKRGAFKITWNDSTLTHSLNSSLQVLIRTKQRWCQWCMIWWYLKTSHFSDAIRYKICQIWDYRIKVMKITSLEFQIPNLNYCQILFVQKLKQTLYLKSSCFSVSPRYENYLIWISESCFIN